MKETEQDQVFVQNFIIVLVMLLGIVTIFVIIARTVGTDEVRIAKRRAQVIAEQTRPVATVRVSDTATAPATPAAAGDTAVAADADPGKATYEGTCFSCHGTGLPNVPQVGHADHWADRIAQGEATLHEHAIKGFAGTSGMMMPPKGGNASLSDEQVKAAVDYMVANSQAADAAPAP